MHSCNSTWNWDYQKGNINIGRRDITCNCRLNRLTVWPDLAKFRALWQNSKMFCLFLKSNLYLAKCWTLANFDCFKRPNKLKSTLSSSHTLYLMTLEVTYRYTYVSLYLLLRSKKCFHKIHHRPRSNYFLEYLRSSLAMMEVRGLIRHKMWALWLCISYWQV